MAGLFGQDCALQPLGFTIISSVGSTHTEHWDYSALRTCLAPVNGAKLVTFSVVEDPYLPTPFPPPVNSKLPQDLVRLLNQPGVKIGQIVLQKGDEFMFPEGTVHIVQTVDVEGGSACPTITQGFFYTLLHYLEAMVCAWIKDIFWSVWTNGSYGDRLRTFAYLLGCHLSSTSHENKAHGSNLYALLFLAKIAHFPQPDMSSRKAFLGWQPALTSKKIDNPSSTEELAACYLYHHGKAAIEALSELEKLDYKEVEQRLECLLLSEYTRRADPSIWPTAAEEKRSK
ncbi:hypothetical protein DL93DRAFT_575659 [Clavulina sp. PMI_390]|nr:hypothetical protein DL93DRAFT_575659 [Clavulina sp. PMI_390]